jgi:Xaa-Pro aminopeptidase
VSVARRARALEVAAAAGADAVLAAQAATVTWLSGYAAPIETGPSPWALPPLAVLAAGGPPVLVVSEDDAAAASGLGCEVVSYPGYELGPFEPVRHAARALATALDGRRRLATEPGALPAALAEGLVLLDATDALARARAVKDADEVERLRAAIRVCDAGQAEARRRAVAGTTELAAWAAVRAAMEAAAGGRFPLLADFISGPRTAGVEGPPGERALGRDDLLVADLVPRIDGYWGDSCATVCVGEPSLEARRAHKTVRERLERLLEACRPGVRSGDLDALARDGLRYPHHSGHGVGTAYHEEPRIVPGWATVLQPGMVLALEPAWYGEREGVRLEVCVLVTADGCEVLSRHELEL